MNINKSISWPNNFSIWWSHVYSISSYFCHIFTYYFLNFRFSVFSERKQSALLTQINDCNRGMFHSAVLWVKIEFPTWKNIILVYTFTNSTPSHDLWALLLKVMVRIYLSPSTPLPHTHTHRLHHFFSPPVLQSEKSLKSLPSFMFIHVKPVTFESFHQCLRFCISKSIQIY